MKRLRPYLIALLPVMFVLLPLAVSAQTSGLVPCGNAPYTNADAAASCNLCNLGQLVQNIINFLVALTIPVAIALFAWAGALYFTSAGNSEKVSKAKKIFFDVLFGFILALSGYLVIQVALNAIVAQSFFGSGTNFFTLQCSTQQRPMDSTISQLISSVGTNGSNSLSTSNPSAPGNNGTGVGSTGPGAGAVDISQYCTSGTCTQEQALAAINAYNATANGNQLKYSSNVSFNGVQQSTLQSIMNDVAACQCGAVTVTSADDSTHATNSEHYAGTAVDIGRGASDNAAFDQFITNNPDGRFTAVQNFISPSAGAAYKDNVTGMVFSPELPNATANTTGYHWHISPDGH